MGIVYEAVELALDRHVALKLLPPQWVSHPSAVARFRREARAAGRLHHTNIVPVFGVGEDRNQLYYAMQFIDGEGLDRIWKRLRDGTKEQAPAPPSSGLAGQSNGSATPMVVPSQPLLFSHEGSNSSYYRLVALIGQQVAGALAFAHGEGIIHRDIKPSNLLLDRKGNVWIADFGLASAFEGDEGLTETGDVMGTYRFMAPERFDGVTDKPGDVYALGVTLYELLTHKVLFPESDRARLIQRILHTQPVAPRKVDHRIPHDLNTIVLKAISKEPAKRYQTAAGLAEDLRRFQDGEPIDARRTRAPERCWLWCKRNPWLAAAAGTVVAAVLTVTALMAFFSVEQRKFNVEQRKSLAEANRRLAEINFEQGYAALEKGDSGVGLLRMGETHRLALAAGDAGWAHTAEMNLAFWHRSLPSVKAVFSHTKAITCVASSPDGKTVVTGSRDKTARLWDVETGRQVGEDMVHRGTITVVLFSPDGQTVATGSADQTARLWYSDSGKPASPPLEHPQDQDRGRYFKQPATVVAAAFSPDGKLLVTGCEKGGWDPNGYRGTWMTLVSGESLGFGRFPEGYCGSSVLWETKSGKALWSSFEEDTRTHRVESAVRWVAFRPDGRIIYIDNAYGLEERDATSHKSIKMTAFEPQKVFNKGGELIGVRDPFPSQLGTFSFSGRTKLYRPHHNLLGFWQNELQAPTPPTPDSAVVAGLHQGPIIALAQSPDGKMLATGGTDRTARLWDGTSFQPIATPLVHQSQVTAVAFGPDGRTLIAGCEDGQVRLWALDVESTFWIVSGGAGESDRAWSLSRDRNRMAVYHDGRMPRPNDNRVKLVDAGRPGEERYIVPGLARPGSAGVIAVAINPDGKLVYTLRRKVNDDGSLSPGKSAIELWDFDAVSPGDVPTSRPLASYEVDYDDIRKLELSPDGKLAITASENRALVLWRTDTWQVVGSTNVGYSGVRAMAFSPDSRRALTLMQDGKAIAFSSGGKDRGSLLNRATRLDSPRPITCASFRPDGTTILAGSQDGTVGLFDADTGHRLSVSLVFSLPVSALAFSGDGRTLVVATEEGPLRMFDSVTLRPIGKPVPHPAGVAGLAVSDDGYRLFTLSRDGLPRRWEIPRIPAEGSQVVTWSELLTGLTIGPQGSVTALESKDWLERREMLSEASSPQR
jgi:WD40 repeat protein